MENAKMNLALGMVYFKAALAEVSERDYASAFNDYVHAFLSRLSTRHAHSMEFVSFFRYQFAYYLLSRKDFVLSLAEGDMIADLIEDTFEEYSEAISSSPFNISGKGRENILDNAEIVFPVTGKASESVKLLVGNL